VREVDFTPGSLVRARGREWVVLPESESDFLILRPLAGSDDEIAGLATGLEAVESAHFPPPDPSRPGDHRSSRLLRDAVRLSSRAAAGPFRSFARIAVDPRPYQIVPLLMALRQSTVRLLIADDVGIGKTVEACLIARELLDRAEIQRLAVLCPPHLARWWQQTLSEQFHIDAELVLPSTVNRLERQLGLGVTESLFDRVRFVVVSLDYIKSEVRREDFARACPEFVIVDEAHTCATGYERGARQQRHQLVKRLAADQQRHIVLVTATPHSGNEAAFRSLLAILNSTLGALPADLTGRENESRRRELARFLVQRRRGDIRHYLDSETVFPDREEAERSYQLSPAYRKLFKRVIEYARETIRDNGSGAHRQRVRWWSILALLRSLASSPRAAAATLRTRAAAAGTADVEEADEVGRLTVLDLESDELADAMDAAPGADSDAGMDDGAPDRRRLQDMAREADALAGKGDVKLEKGIALVRSLLDDGFNPIVFCRFIPTAGYVAEQLRAQLPTDVTIAYVTGELAADDREERVRLLGKASRRVLICTDCLSEGINLQQWFDAVVHYDLSWNPTRHEQRAGRVDRFGQLCAKVRILTYYGTDNGIDGIVLDVLLRKYKRIRDRLGIAVPVPSDPNAVMEAVLEGLLLRDPSGGAQEVLPGFEDVFRPVAQRFEKDWDAAADREERSRSVFAQSTLKVDAVALELTEARAAVGGAQDVETFLVEALAACGAVVERIGAGIAVDAREAPHSLVDRMPAAQFRAAFTYPAPTGVTYVGRTHPIVESLSAYVLDGAMDPLLDGPARRCGAIRTCAVMVRTTLLIVRHRFEITERRADSVRAEIAEECRLLAFGGAPERAAWLDDASAQALLNVSPDANIAPEQSTEFVRKVVDGLNHLTDHLVADAGARAAKLLDSHQRVRAATRVSGRSCAVEPILPADVLGIYVFLPAAG
jgi:superfamily II DNA or RNA helicase